MSKIFSFTPDYEWCIDADRIIQGGSGYAIKLENGLEVYHKENDQDLPSEIEHVYPDYSLYSEITKNTAFGFLSRGCPRGCHFCHVAAKEGQSSYKVADLSEFWRGQKNVVLNDPNILGCPDHRDLLQQLIDAKVKAEFNQGLDVRLITEKNIDLIRKIPMKYIHFAFDRYEDKPLIVPKLRAFMEETGYDHRKVMCYILVNFDTTFEQDLERIQICRDLDIDPFVMIYDKAHADKKYRRLQRWVNNDYIFWKVPTFEQFNTNGYSK